MASAWTDWGELGSLLGMGSGMQNSSIAGASPVPAQASGMNPMAMLSGFKGPAPISPIMSGGVSGGGQPAPAANNAALASNPLYAALMSLITRNGAPQVPGLGALLSQQVRR